MTQEEKELLVKDICSRLPYGVKFSCTDLEGIWTLNSITSFIDNGKKTYNCNIMHRVDVVRPYLRPLWRMTKNEESEWRKLVLEPLLSASTKRHTRDDDLLLIAKSSHDGIEFLLKNHFDFNGLIPRGLAIEVTYVDNPYK